jgi:ketosteroid isomerase-like protein
MKPANAQIAESFSAGNFETAYPYLAENVVWAVPGENTFSGRAAVIENCSRTAAYFKSVTTRFEMLNLVNGGNRIAVNGTAEFLKDGKRLAFVWACDMYEFNDEDLLQNITSYCITEKQ